MKIIAETAWHHDGDFNYLIDLTKAISNYTHTDYIKYHITLDIDEYMYFDHSGYNWVKERVFDTKQWEEVLRIAVSGKKKLMLLFNDKKAIDFGMRYNPELVEIHSVCLNDINLIEHLKNQVEEKTKIVLGVGGSTLYEIENAIRILDNKHIVLMHGFQNYPTNYQDINFNKVKRIMNLFPEFEHGYADHTAWDNENNVLITLIGAALGMDYIEKHVTLNSGEKRADWQSAISIDVFNDLIANLSLLNECNGNGLLELNPGEKSYSIFGPMKKAAILNRKVLQGECLTMDMFTFKRTSQTSDLSQIEIISRLGQKFVDNYDAGYCVNSKNLI